MSNVKAISIEARVPFCWLDSAEYGPAGKGTTDEQAALVGRLLAGPSLNLRVDYRPDGSDENSNGGSTAMYRMHVHGEEALRFNTLDALVEAIEAGGGTILVNDIIDLEA